MMMTETRTHAEVLTAHGLDASGLGMPDMTIPTAGAATPQGDVMVLRRDRAPQSDGRPIMPGVPVVVVEAETASRNRHELHADFGSSSVMWAPATRGDSDLTLGWVTVPDGQGALLLHTDEHGALALTPGVYEIRRQREFAGEWRRVAD